MLVNADLHIHSPYSMAVSREMHPEKLLKACTIKGIHVLGSGDALHPGWRKIWEPYLENEEGIAVVPSAEVEDKRRVHHLILADELAPFKELMERFDPACKGIRASGRPHLHLSGEEIAAAAHAAGAMIGPAHAFTPWTGVYAYYDRLSDCYGEEPLDFLELGLSADSSYGAAIPELAGVPFLSNSDAHSPVPEKIGREFNRIEVKNLSAKGVLDCIRRGAVTMNAGFFPEEGKYNRTACTRCFTHYSPEYAGEHSWKCGKDGGRIKKGVFDRAQELAGKSTAKVRPPYLHIVPLGQIIQTMEGTSSPCTKGCRALYSKLIAQFGTEIAILIDVPVEDIRKIHRGVGDAVQALRAGTVILHPGGGGQYGTFSLA